MDPLNKEMASEHEIGLAFFFILLFMLFVVLMQVIDPVKSLLKGLDDLAQVLRAYMVAVEHAQDLANGSKHVYHGGRRRRHYRKMDFKNQALKVET